MTSTVVGAGPPLAIGSAFAQQYKNSKAITVVFFGDGAFWGGFSTIKMYRTSR